MSEFDEKAADWDANPDHFERAAKLADYMRKHVDFSKVTKALEYGSGTGLLSFALKDCLPDITLMDSSEKMTEAAIEKVKTQKISNLHPIQYDFLEQKLPNDRYDLIFILQTLHHIKDTGKFFEKSATLLNTKGSLVIIDLVTEDGTFHDDPFDGHKGFDRGKMEELLTTFGLQPKHYGICHTIEKEMEDGTIKKYPLFMMVGTKQ